MNRQEILDRYKVNEHGIITSPGKFEGEMLYAPYYYDAMLNGWTDFDEWIEPDIAEYEMFPELNEVKRIRMSEDDSGFVWLEHE